MTNFSQGHRLSRRKGEFHFYAIPVKEFLKFPHFTEMLDNNYRWSRGLELSLSEMQEKLKKSVVIIIHKEDLLYGFATAKDELAKSKNLHLDEVFWFEKYRSVKVLLSVNKQIKRVLKSLGYQSLTAVYQGTEPGRKDVYRRLGYEECVEFNSRTYLLCDLGGN